MNLMFYLYLLRNCAKRIQNVYAYQTDLVCGYLVN